jgi:hypothetical protein
LLWLLYTTYKISIFDIYYSCLRNVVALFHVIEKELEWRRARGQLEGFGAMKSSKPLVAVGALHPLEDTMLMADYFRTPSKSSR